MPQKTFLKSLSEIKLAGNGSLLAGVVFVSVEYVLFKTSYFGKANSKTKRKSNVLNDELNAGVTERLEPSELIVED